MRPLNAIILPLNPLSLSHSPSRRPFVALFSPSTTMCNDKCNPGTSALEEVFRKSFKCSCPPRCPDHEPVATFVVLALQAHDYWKLKAAVAVLQAKIWEAAEGFDDFSGYDLKIIDYEVGGHVKASELSLLTTFPTLLDDLLALKEQRRQKQAEEVEQAKAQ